jgi:choline dehydrogenase
MTQAFVRAGQEMGLEYVNDFNGASQQGVGYYQTTTRSGERCSTSKAYLKRVRGNDKLTVITGALTHKVLFSEGRAVGVEFSEKQGSVQTAWVRNEVILSAGAFGSPKILMQSGIGPKEHLSELGIDTLLDLPVGKNLHDHLHVSLNATTHASNSLLGEDKGLRAISHMFQWAAFRSGLLTTNVLEGGAFIDSLGVGRPDIQLMFLPVLDNFDNTPGEKPPAQEHGLTVKTGHVRPEARGQLRLRSKDPQDQPLIDPNYLGTQADLEGQIRAVQVGLRLMEQPSLKALIKKVTAPEEMDWRDTKALEAFVRQNIKTVYHPTGTCRLGQDRASSVTGLDLRVHGVPNLRVVDLSVCPMVTSGNTNATAIMIGERGAAQIVGRPLAAPEPEPVRAPAPWLKQV